MTLTNWINTTRVQNFRTFCAVFNQVSNAFFSLREATRFKRPIVLPQPATRIGERRCAGRSELTAVAPQANNVAQPETFSAG